MLKQVVHIVTIGLQRVKSEECVPLTSLFLFYGEFKDFFLKPCYARYRNLLKVRQLEIKSGNADQNLKIKTVGQVGSEDFVALL
jgi:hypothetical protein